MTETTTELAPIVRTITVGCDRERAFRAFSREMLAWWPAPFTRAKSAEGQTTVAITMEPRVGGRLYESVSTGEEHDWGEVTEYEPYSRIAMLFHIGWERERAGLVEVEFTPVDGGGCRVTLTHSGWEKLADRAAAMRERFVPGWEYVFDTCFGNYLRQA